MVEICILKTVGKGVLEHLYSVRELVVRVRKARAEMKINKARSDLRVETALDGQLQLWLVEDII